MPFTPEQFFDVFRAYNATVWPAQVLLHLLALAAAALAFRAGRGAGVAISLILAFLWTWVGFAYHLAFFAVINPAAIGFGLASIVAAGLFLWHGALRRRLRFRCSMAPLPIAGLVLIVFALAAYPLWSTWSGHAYPALPTFGLPCPTTLFTLGMLALLEPPYPRSPLIIPLVWSAIGAQAAVLLDWPADLSLIAAGLLGVVLLARARAI